MKRYAAIAMLPLCAILSGCAGLEPSPPPAVLPGVEAVDVKPMPSPKVPKAKLPTFQPVHNLYFDTGVDTLKRGQVKLLAKLAEWAEGRSIVVTGYADTVGTEDYNAALSLRRAQAVAQHLPGASVEAKGETSQFGADNKNRRVTLEAR